MGKESKEANENNKAFQEKVILEGQKGEKGDKQNNSCVKEKTQSEYEYDDS